MKKNKKTLKAHFVRYESVYACIFTLLFCFFVAYWFLPFVSWGFESYYNVIYDTDFAYTKDLMLFLGSTFLAFVGLVVLIFMGLVVIAGVVFVCRIIHAFITAKKGERMASCLKIINEDF